MAEEEKINIMEYNESHFKTLEGTSGIRKRPTMYIGGIGSYGAFKLLLEIFTNVVDEFNAGRVTHCIININTKTNEFYIEDNGVGIPLGALYNAITKIHSGAKFDENNGAFKFSAGLNGVGLKATNALSDPFRIEVRRDQKKVVYNFSKGVELSKEETSWEGPTGTIVSWVPDIEILKEVHINKAQYLEAIWTMSCISPGITTTLTFDNKEPHHIFSTQGIVDIMMKRMKESHITPLIPTIRIKGASSEGVGMQYDVVLTWSNSINAEQIYSYVNGLRTAEHGKHVEGLRSGLTTIMKKYIDKKQLIPKNAKFEVGGDDVRENVFAIVSAKHESPLFDGQTKERFTSDEFTSFARSLTVKSFQEWIDNNDEEAMKIAKVIVRLAKAKAAARDAKNMIVKAGGSKNSLFDDIDPDKFKDCKSRKSEECELFIVEGDSAGGSAQQARNSHTQAIYQLRGKVQNIFQDPRSLSKELVMLDMILGCGVGDHFDISKLRFHKVVILTDADDDGGHITALLNGFFYKRYPQLIEHGHIYIGQPPLYLIKSKSHSLYIANSEHYEFVMREIAVKTFNLISSDNNQISEGLFRIYLDRLKGYKDMMDQFSIQITVNPQLLELVVRNFGDLINGNIQEFIKFGYITKIVERKNRHLLIDFDRGYEHAFLKIDEFFYDNIYRPIYQKLSNIHLSNVRLQGVNSKKIYGGTTYDISSIITQTIRGKNTLVKRFKGLGEMNPEQLRVTAMNPDTRNIIKLSINDYDVAADWMGILLGKGDKDRKKEMFINTDEMEDES